VSDQPQTHRPVGWWLKEANSRLDAAFDAALTGRAVDRRGWQVLATLAQSTTPGRQVLDALASFDDRAAVEAVLHDLGARGWVKESGGMLRLTTDGERAHATLSPLVADIRQQVSAALPDQDYAELLRLARLVAAFPNPSRRSPSKGKNGPPSTGSADTR
jgi:hypothetical protein